MSDLIYLSAREAAAELGVQPATLYAYVSRGQIRSVPGPGKQRRYLAEDIRGLRDGRRPDEAAVEAASQLKTELTLITEDGPYYRGQAATALAGISSLEAIATLLWQCEADPFAHPAPRGLPKFPEGLGAIERAMMAVASWPIHDRAAYTLAPQLLKKSGAALLRFGVGALLQTDPSADPVHLQLQSHWKVSGNGGDLLRAALVLSADHELNTSAYAVRCAASTRAPLHAALSAGLGAFAGPRHGSSSDRVLDWLERINTPNDVEAVLVGRLSRGEQLPGFGHGVYKDRDPRADCLLDRIAAADLNHPLLECLPAIISMAEELFGVAPNIDFTLAVLQRVLGLPADAGKVIFCAGRMVGWIAHALEQYEHADQIRPRAVYVGARPR